MPIIFINLAQARLTSTMCKRLTKAARCAIKMRSGIPNRKHATELLHADLHNGPLHCLGVHTNCSTNCYKVLQGGTSSTSTKETPPNASKEPVAAQQQQAWEDAFDEENLESVHSTTTQVPENLDPEMMLDIQHAVGRLIAKADQLLGRQSVQLQIINTKMQPN